MDNIFGDYHEEEHIVHYEEPKKGLSDSERQAIEYKIGDLRWKVQRDENTLRSYNQEFNDLKNYPPAVVPFAKFIYPGVVALGIGSFELATHSDGFLGFLGYAGLVPSAIGLVVTAGFHIENKLKIKDLSHKMKVEKDIIDKTNDQIKSLEDELNG